MSHVGTFRELAGALLLSPEGKHSTAGVLHETSERLFRQAQQAGGIREDVSVLEVMHLVSGITYACGNARAIGKSVQPDRLIDLIMDGLRAAR